jgi:hypothetical protein
MSEESTPTETNISSIKISRNTKGVTFEVKVYDPDVALAESKAKEIFNRLAKTYPEAPSA